jgi:hypothetical protein
MPKIFPFTTPANKIYEKDTSRQSCANLSNIRFPKNASPTATEGQFSNAGAKAGKAG